MASSTVTVALRSRSVLRVAGADAINFLQGLVTADVGALTTEAPATAAMFLDRRGRVRHGGLAIRTGDECILLDVPTMSTKGLTRHLNMFKLRAAVDVSDVTTDMAVHVVLPCRGEVSSSSVSSGSSNSWPLIPTAVGMFHDPRLPALGLRMVVPRDADLSALSGYSQGDERGYTRWRLIHGIPDDADFESEPLPLELGLHFLGGVSFEKGCYLGQELTARTHFTGVIRKRFTPIVAVETHGEDGDGIAMRVLTTAFDVRDDMDEKDGTKMKALRVGDEVFVEGRDRPVGKLSSADGRVGGGVIRQTEGDLSRGDGQALIALAPHFWSTTATTTTDTSVRRKKASNASD